MNSFITSPKYADADATGFISSANINDLTQINAVYSLTTALKTNNLWSSMQVIYPFVGGTATSHGYNLKDPRNVDAASYIVWHGSVTHNSLGSTGDGSTGYGDTRYNPRSSATLNSHHMSVYVGTDVSGAMYDMGGYDGTTENMIVARYNTNTGYTSLNSAPTTITAATSTSLGYWNSSRTASNAIALYRNGGSFASGSTASNNTCNFNIGLMCSNRATPISFSTKRIQFATIGLGLTSGQASTLYTIVQNFQIALGRAV